MTDTPYGLALLSELRRVLCFHRSAAMLSAHREQMLSGQMPIKARRCSHAKHRSTVNGTARSQT